MNKSRTTNGKLINRTAVRDLKSRIFSLINSYNFFIHMNNRLILLLLPLLLLCAPSAAQLPGGMIKSPLEIRRQQQRAKRKAKPKARPKAKAKAKPQPRKKSQVSARPRRQGSTARPKPQGPSPTLGTSTHVPNVLTFRANGVTFQMVEVQGGTFMMGATSEQGSDAENDEKPAHRVPLSGFYIGKYEVT